MRRLVIPDQRRQEDGFTLVELLIVVAIIGILAAIAIPNLMMALQRSRQKRSMVNIRHVATAWEARATDFARYNAAGAAVPGVSEPVAMTDLAAMLAPTYIKSLPMSDGWGRALSCHLDEPLGSSTVANRYAIISPARDATYETSPTFGPFVNFDCDIIYSNGTFLTYPAAAGSQ